MGLLVFDSGIGGLGVVAALRALWPGVGLDYLADDGFFPYGEKADELLVARILAVVGAAIARLRPEVVVVACNTASTLALGALREAFAVPFVGCVPPVKPAAAASLSRVIGVLATPATVRRGYLKGLVARFGAGCEVHSLGVVELAAMAERKFAGEAVDLETLGAIVGRLFEAGPAIDAVALGCTHYTFLLEEFLAVREGVKWFDPAGAVARQAVRVGQDVGVSGGGGRFFVTGSGGIDGRVRGRVEAYGFAAFERLDVLVS